MDLIDKIVLGLFDSIADVQKILIVLYFLDLLQWKWYQVLFPLWSLFILIIIAHAILSILEKKQGKTST